MRLHDIANAAHTEIENQQIERRKLHKAADNQFMANTRDHYRALDSLEAHYSAAAFNLACGLGQSACRCPGPATGALHPRGGTRWAVDDLARLGRPVLFP